MVFRTSHSNRPTPFVTYDSITSILLYSTGTNPSMNVGQEHHVLRLVNMEFFGFDHADPTRQSPNAEQDNELANLFASISPPVKEIDFLGGEIQAMNSCDQPGLSAPSPSATGDAIPGTEYTWIGKHYCTLTQLHRNRTCASL